MDTTQRFLEDWDALRHEWLPEAPFPYGGASRVTALEGIAQFATCTPLEVLLMRRRDGTSARPMLRVRTTLSDDALAIAVTPVARREFAEWPAGRGAKAAGAALLVVPLGHALSQRDAGDPWRIEEEWHRRVCDLAVRGHALLIERLARDFELDVVGRPVFEMESPVRLRIERTGRGIGTVVAPDDEAVPLALAA